MRIFFKDINNKNHLIPYSVNVGIPAREEMSNMWRKANPRMYNNLALHIRNKLSYLDTSKSLNGLFSIRNEGSTQLSDFSESGYKVMNNEYPSADNYYHSLTTFPYYDGITNEPDLSDNVPINPLPTNLTLQNYNFSPLTQPIVSNVVLDNNFWMNHWNNSTTDEINFNKFTLSLIHI